MDLARLHSYLSGLGTPLALSATDANLQELGGWLESAPTRGVRLTGSVGVQLDSAHEVLTISGTTGDAWPVERMQGLGLTLSHIAITVDASGTAPQITALAQASLSGLASDAVPVTVSGLPPDSQGVIPWRIGLTGDVDNVTVEGLLTLVEAGDPPYTLPTGFDLLTLPLTLAASDFGLTFYPGTGFEALYLFAIEAPSFSWKLVPDVLEIDGARVVVQAKTSSYAVTLVVDLVLGSGLALDLGIGLSGGSLWTASVTPGKGATTFPTLSQIADWIAGHGTSQAGAIKAALAALPHVDASGFDAAIEAVAVTFDASQRTLTNVEVDSRVEFAGMPLDVRLALPDLRVDGALAAGANPPKLSTVMAAFGDWANDLPVDAAIETVAFSAQPGAGRYGGQLALTGTAKAGPSFELDELSVAISYSSATGVHGQIECVLDLWDVAQLDLTAAYDTGAGWAFAGRTVPGELLAADQLIEKLASEFDIDPSTVPQPLATLSITGVAVEYATATKAFRFGCIGDFVAYDTPIEIAPAVAVTPVDPTDLSKGYTHTFGGRLNAGGVAFDLGMSSDPTSTDIVASLVSGATPIALDLAWLVSSLSPALGALVPSGLSLGLKTAKIASISGGSEGRRVAAGIDLAASLSLSDLPLIGSRLPAGETLAFQDLQVMYGHDPIAPADVVTLNALLPAAAQFPAAGVSAGAVVFASVAIGDGPPATLRLPLGAPASTQADALEAAPTPATPAAPVAQWWTVQRQIGSVHFQRFGILYAGGALFFAIDGSIQAGPLTLSMQGLGIGSPLSRFEPELRLDGIGISYDQPPLEVAGAVLRVDPAPAGTRYQFDGTLTIAATGFSLAAVGSYAVLESGEPSLFVYGQLERALGGPPAFFVTGLMAGFGFNRTLAIPGQDEVLDFPLLALNAPVPPGKDPPAPGDVLKVLEGDAAGPSGATRQWITAQPGAYWLAAGVEFTSFELVHSRALLVAELGDELVFALVGLSTIQLPQEGSPYAYAELELEAVLKPNEGFFGLTAILSPNSYVLTPDCHLTGGFAFYVWFDPSEHAGQFVLTLGGYHPAFTPPDYFPQVPRLGFNWAVSDNVSIGGDAYFALTTSSVMAGGRLEALFHDGDLQAWFDMSADVLISWRPFYFTAELSVEIGVSYRLSLLFTHVTISLSLGATIDMWGPPTGGTVYVQLWCVSFSVDFGSDGAPTATQPLEWSEFAGLLPGPDKAVRLIPTGALYKTQTSANSSSNKLWVVRATGFTFTTESAVPASHLCYGDVAQGGDPTAGTVHSGDAVDIRPMNRSQTTSVHRLAIRRGGATAPALDPTSGWQLDQNARNVPGALWGQPPQPFTQTPGAPANEVVDQQLVGFSVTAPPPVLGASGGVFLISELAYAPLDPGTMPLVPNASDSGEYVPVAESTSVADIQGIADLAGTRTALCTALGPLYTGPDDPMTAMRRDAHVVFSDAPMVQA